MVLKSEMKFGAVHGYGGQAFLRFAMLQNSSTSGESSFSLETIDTSVVGLCATRSKMTWDPHIAAESRGANEMPQPADTNATASGKLRTKCSTRGLKPDS